MKGTGEPVRPLSSTDVPFAQSMDVYIGILQLGFFELFYQQ